MSLKLRDRPKSSTGPQSPDDNEGCYKLVMESDISGMSVSESTSVLFTDRRLGCGKILPAWQIPEWLEHKQLHLDDRGGHPDPGDGDQQQEGQGAGLGHGGPAEVQTHPGQLLPGGPGGYHRIRRDQHGELQQRQAVARRGGGVRHRIKSSEDIGKKRFLKNLMYNVRLSFQVGNKADLTDRREVEFETAEEFASQNSIPYIETSVIGKSNIKVRSWSLYNDDWQWDDNDQQSFQEAFLELVRRKGK